jgi:hypothetical protein
MRAKRDRVLAMVFFRVCFAALLIVSHVGPASADRAQVLATVRAAIADPFNDGAFKKYLALLPKVQNPLEKGTTLYLVEGDLPMTENQVRTYLIEYRTSRAQQDEKELKLAVVGAGEKNKWAPTERTLKYAVMRASFKDQAKYDLVVSDMAAASGDWVNACDDCGLKFVHVPNLDRLDDPFSYLEHLQKDVIRFVVIFSDVTGADPANAYVARAFFPSAPAHLRSLILDRTYFDHDGKPFTRIGVLRHELGHVLGYRHEHIRGEAGCWSEGGQWKPLTPYDGKSIMHYPCGAAAARGDFVFSDLDKVGHRKHYALPK